MKSIEPKILPKDNGRKKYCKVSRLLSIAVVVAIVVGTLPSCAKTDNIDEVSKLPILRDVEVTNGVENEEPIRIADGIMHSDSEILATPAPTNAPAPMNAPEPAMSKSGLPIVSNNARYQYIMGTDYKAYTIYNQPTEYRNDTEAKKNMLSFTVPVWKMTSSGEKISSIMTITVHKKLAESVASIFKEIYALDMKFPIKTLLGYSYRKVGGVGLMNSNLMSAHTFGCAIDINPGDYDNDYYLGKGNDLRDKSNPYCIPDEVIDIFESHGWFWGGDFEICSDTMHFQYLGLEFLTYKDMDSFRTLSYIAGNTMRGTDVRNLQQRLNKLGYTVDTSGNYNKKSAEVVTEFQKTYGLTATGVVDYETWETIINLTHDMNYVCNEI